jgi:hypothetical protein
LGEGKVYMGEISARVADKPFAQSVGLQRRVTGHLVLSLGTAVTLLLAVGAHPRGVRAVPNLVANTAQMACVVRGVAPALDTAIEILTDRVAFGDATVVTVDAYLESAKLIHIYTKGRYPHKGLG